MGVERCESCRFVDLRLRKDISGENVWAGICRKNPPISGAFPVVREPIDWCGEWEYCAETHFTYYGVFRLGEGT